MIEEILPINYYNQLIGILVDTTILKMLIKQLMPKLSSIIENNKDYDGNFIGDIFINKLLINMFVSKSIDRDISLLIFDYLFLKGNKIIFQVFLSIYQFLQDIIIKEEKSIENFNKIINEDLKKLNIKNEAFIYDVFFKYEKIISKVNIDEKRNIFSVKIAQNLEDKNIEFIKSKVKLYYNSELYEKQMDKYLKCHKEWPYCINDSYFENVTRVIEHLSFSKSKINYVDNYFFANKQKIEKNKENPEENEQNHYNIVLERRPHYCIDIENQISTNKIEEDKESNIINEENIFKEKVNNIENDGKEDELDNKIEFIRNTIADENFLNISKIVEEKIIEDINEK